ncbi:MAG: trehalose utilization protein [Verrucomicrobiales bacterium]|jgi:trehalose utilization protein|nr:trehalose utilization protein [Verrucomicrobiales bacterium]
MRTLFAQFTFFLCILSVSAREIRVLIWDEQQPAQKQIYTNFLGNQIAESLKGNAQLSVKTAKLADPEQGISAESIDQCDVLIWWGHVRNGEVDPARAAHIVDRIKQGKLSLIALHSAHWSEPFVQAMRERTREDAPKHVPAGVRNVKFEYKTPERFKVPKIDDPLTPSYQLKTGADGTAIIEVTYPNCVFPSFRPDGAPGHLTTLLPKHPIANGVPLHFEVPHTEMYNEPFHVPTPDEVIFEERWDKGEHFRSGCVWNVGKGKVFYFRPGHETFDVYLQPVTLKIIANAVDWLGGQSL